MINGNFAEGGEGEGKTGIEMNRLNDGIRTCTVPYPTYRNPLLVLSTTYVLYEALRRTQGVGVSVPLGLCSTYIHAMVHIVGTDTRVYCICKYSI